MNLDRFLNEKNNLMSNLSNTPLISIDGGSPWFKP